MKSADNLFDKHRPTQNPIALSARLTDEAQKALNPYECDNANKALAEMRGVGVDAEREFKEVYELLGYPKNVDEILQKVKIKHNKLSRKDFLFLSSALDFGDNKNAEVILIRFGYVKHHNNNDSNLSVLFSFPDGRKRFYHSRQALNVLLREALDELLTRNMVE